MIATEIRSPNGYTPDGSGGSRTFSVLCEDPIARHDAVRKFGESGFRIDRGAPVKIVLDRTPATRCGCWRRWTGPG
jgi:hypothetical protein